MTKKISKNTFFIFCLFVFLFISVFSFPATKVSADLEVHYPTIAGQTLTKDTKLPDFVLYLFNAGIFFGFIAVLISLVIAGIMYFLSPISSDARAIAKDRVSGAISGLLILTFTYLIITTINPQLRIFSMTSGPKYTPQEQPKKIDPGVYLYQKTGCSDDSVTPYKTSIPDLGNLKNKVHSVSIKHDTENQISYVAIMYQNPDFSGKCQYIDPNKSCESLTDPFASSTSVYKYDFNPNGDGIYFFRKSCFDSPGSDIETAIKNCKKNSGGYFQIKNSDIGGGTNLYVKSLEELNFTNVPIDEQNCIKYDKDGKCTEDGKKTPTLGGENISSMIINGNYIVLFVYSGSGDSSTGPWTYCQEFPTSKDVNKYGPQQIKWENIRNSAGVVPNYMIVIPVQGEKVATPLSGSDDSNQ